jgi:hypothetical protein
MSLSPKDLSALAVTEHFSGQIQAAHSRLYTQYLKQSF